MSRKLASAAGVVALIVTAAALVAAPVTARPLSAATVTPPVVRISVQGGQATVSQKVIRPGVVEFRVGQTFHLPQSQGGADTLNVLATEDLDGILGAAAVAYDPAAARGAQAQAMDTIRRLGTFYGGAGDGATWQVRLPAGSYFVLGPKSTAMGLSKPAQFTVVGSLGATRLHPTSATVRAVYVNGFESWAITGLSSTRDGWLKLANSTASLHSLDVAGVKPGTTSRMVERAASGKADWTFTEPRGLHFDVVSPGVSVAIKGSLAAGRYVITSFVPSQVNGRSDAANGMWKLVGVG